MTEDLIIRRLDRLEEQNRKILKLLAGDGKPKWIGASDLMKLTGWNKDAMYRMRSGGVVEFKKMGRTIVYNPASVPAIFIKQAVLQ